MSAWPSQRQPPRPGASVTVASRNPASVESALAQLPAGSAGRAVEASSAEELAAFFQFLGDFDHFAYTAAGPLVPNPLAEYTAQAGQAFFELRLVAALDAIRLAVPRIRPGGSITMTSGTAAFRGSAAGFSARPRRARSSRRPERSPWN